MTPLQPSVQTLLSPLLPAPQAWILVGSSPPLAVMLLGPSFPGRPSYPHILSNTLRPVCLSLLVSLPLVFFPNFCCL